MGCKQNSQFYIALLGDAILITFHTLLTHDGIVGHADPEQQSHRHRVTIPTAQDTSSSFRLIFFADSTMPRAISFGSLFDNSSCITCSRFKFPSLKRMFLSLFSANLGPHLRQFVL